MSYESVSQFLGVGIDIVGELGADCLPEIIRTKYDLMVLVVGFEKHSDKAPV